MLEQLVCAFLFFCWGGGLSGDNSHIVGVDNGNGHTDDNEDLQMTMFICLLSNLY